MQIRTKIMIKRLTNLNSPELIQMLELAEKTKSYYKSTSCLKNYD